ncbi:MAG: hypothetical protein V4857_03440 [Pseudomonadota bacterium]
MKNYKRFLWFGGIGLLPLWVALVLMMVKSIGQPSNYWLTAPFMVVMALPFCLISMALAALPVLVYKSTSGDPNKKMTRAVVCTLLFIALLLAGAGFLWKQKLGNKADWETDVATAQLLVESSPVVQAAAPFRVTLYNSSTDGDRSMEFLVSSEGSPRTLMAFVDVDRESGRPEYRLRCVIPESQTKNLAAGSDPCASAK